MSLRKVLIHSTFCVVALVTSMPAFADKIMLKSGKTVDGTIVERTAKFVKLDVGGMRMTYFSDEINSVEGGPAVPGAVDAAAGGPAGTRGNGVAASSSDATDGNKDKMAEEILVLSGYKKQIESFEAMIDPQIEQIRARMQGKPNSETVIEVLSAAMRNSYKSDRMYRVIYNNLIGEFDQARFAKILEWYHSPLAQKISQLEVDATNVETQQELMQYAADVQAHPPAGPRLELVKKLDTLTQSSDLMIEQTVVSSIQMVKAMQLAMPEDKRMKDPGVEGKIRTQIEQSMAQPAKERSILNFLYVYKTISDDELRQYVQFYESPEGMWLVKNLKAGYLDALASASANMGRYMGEHLPDLKKAAAPATDAAAPPSNAAPAETYRQSTQ